MSFDLNKLAEHMAASLFRVCGVYHYNIPVGQHGTQKAAPYPGFIFPLSGCAEYRFDDTPYLVRAGTVVHGLADAVLKKRVVGKEPWEFISVLYEVYDEPPGMNLSQLHFELTTGASLCLNELLQQLCAASKRPGGIPAFQVETLFRRVLEEVFLCARKKTQYGAEELFETVSSYIHAHYMDSLSVGMLAQMSGANENRLFYVFQKYTGMGPGDYLRTYRLNRARELLVTSDAPIQLVAEQVGYPDAFHFSRMFKKHIGVAPSKFRTE